MAALPPDPVSLMAPSAPASVSQLQRSSQVRSLAGVGGLYFVVALACLWLERSSAPVVLLWCANAVGMAWLAARSASEWPVMLGTVAIAGVLAGGTIGQPAWLTLSSVPVNLGEILIGAWLLQRFATPAPGASKPAVMVGGLLMAGLLPSAAGALCAAGLYSSIGLGSFERLWIEWFQSRALGSLLVLPIGLLAASFERIRLDQHKLGQLADDLQRLYETPPSLMHSVEVTLHAIADGGVSIDADGRILYINPVAEQMLGWSLTEARGLAFGQIVHLFDELSGEGLPSPIERCRAGESGTDLSRQAMLLNRQGHQYGVRDSVAPIVGKDGTLLGVVMVLQDVTEARELTRQLAHLAHHDSLTRLPNRAFFQGRVREACSAGASGAAPLAVVFMDLDHFKHVNDSLGHAVGDELLKIVAQRLKLALREGDIVSRLGGDEFVMLLQPIEATDQINDIAQNILREVARPSLLEGAEVTVGISLGVAVFPQDGEDPDTLMKHADAAMYRAKRGGRNRCQFFSREVDQAASDRLQLEIDMRRGLSEGQFVAHYQPIIDAVSGLPVAMEALARWSPEGREPQGPTSFIPVAEESGLIVPLGEAMLRQACEQLRAWRHSPLSGITIAVNVSPVQLAHESFVDKVAEILQDTGVDGRQLAFEITESTLMSHPEQTLAILYRIKALGIRIAIDDFGTGYSSLSHLKRFPVDSVKIDRSFVRDLETDPDDRELAKAIVAMSRSLRLRVVAEGVETEAQASILSAMGCTSLQGEFYAGAATADITSEWMHPQFLASPIVQ
jgi:diguanylate cyclase (GGDEF)-like protein/PAS domain S-box-containing protein